MGLYQLDFFKGTSPPRYFTSVNSVHSGEGPGEYWRILIAWAGKAAMLKVANRITGLLMEKPETPPWNLRPISVSTNDCGRQ
jgi:hypothetical protein